MGRDEKTHIVTSHMDTVLPSHMSIILLKPVNHAFGITLQPKTLLKIEDNLFIYTE